jgi:hypothetical protein
MKTMSSNTLFASAMHSLQLISRSDSSLPALLSVGFLFGVAIADAQTNTDTDLDRLPNTWESLYGFDSNTENFHVGNGTDGNFAVTSGQTAYVNDTVIGISTVQLTGSKEITGVLPSIMKVGDVFLLHITQEGTPVAGSPAGSFDLVQITSLGTGKVGIKNPLIHTYDPTSGAKIQCVRVPQFNHVQVDGSLTARSWNGSLGGIIALIADDVVITSGGSISASAAGFRGGPGIAVTGATTGLAGRPGEGQIGNVWPPANSSNSNGIGGAGGAIGNPAGVGGIQMPSQNPSFGGGGGSGGCNAYSYPMGSQGFTYFQEGGFGGTGGGLCLIISRSISVGGSIFARGTSGQAASYQTDFGYARSISQGGGGAGGALLLISRISGSGTISATSDSAAAGKIRIERGTASTLPPSTSTGDGYFDSQSFSFLATYNDPDGDGLDDFGEFLAETSPILADTDSDGVPDGWEVRYGTKATISDAAEDPDLDGMTNLQEFRAGSHPKSTDGDGDGITDVLELSIYGTDPLASDTDGDGMDDGWEITNGLNPLLNDSGDDWDLDGLTNKEEYDQRTNGYRANAGNSIAGTPGDDHLSDYRRLRNEGWVKHRYDKNDRLISTERENGMAQLYRYDGNSQKVKDVLTASLDADGDGLPDSWEFAHNLTYTGSNAATGNNGPLGDPDLDGFTNLAEWKAGTDPKSASSHPVTGAAAMIPSVTASSGFTPTNWVMTTGQLDGYGADEVVVGADGAIGASSNSLSLLTQNQDSWTSLSIPVGNVGITSLVAGRPVSGNGPSIFVGSRPPSGAGLVSEYASNGSTWTKSVNAVATGTGSSLAQAIGLSAQGLISLGSPSGLAADAIYGQRYTSGTWNSPLVLDGTSGKRDWPIASGAFVARWLDAGGIQVLGTNTPAASLGAVQRPGSANWYFLTPSTMNWTDAEAYAVQNGGHLVTIDDAAENTWLWSQYSSSSPWIGLSRELGSSISTGWKWASGGSSSYRNWSPGQPDFAGGNELYGHLYSTEQWNDLPDTSARKGIVEISAASSSATTFPDPAATAKLVWRGHSLAIGNLRANVGTVTSIVFGFIDDKNTSATCDNNDDFVIGEYDLGFSPAIQRTLVRLPLSTPDSAGAYALTTLHRADSSKPSVLLAGEPDGTVSIWTAADPYSPLIRKVLSTEFKGKAWHQLEPLKEADGKEGLVGLLVDPATPTQCRVIRWSADTIEVAVAGTAPVLNNLPLARVLNSPASGGSHSAVGVRSWDAEANASAITLQYQMAGQSIWTSATLLSADGLSGNLGTTGNTIPLGTSPGGQNHFLLWNVAADLGSTFSGTILLRTRATDADTGVWSSAVAFTVDSTSDLDDDGDGFTNSNELPFGTDPHSPTSTPKLVATRMANSSLQLVWPTALGRTYRLESSTDLTQWTTLQSGLNIGTITLPSSTLTSPSRFYRIAAE